MSITILNIPTETYYDYSVRSSKSGYKSEKISFMMSADGTVLNRTCTEEITEDVYQSLGLSEIFAYFYYYSTNESNQQILVSGAKFTLMHLAGKSLEKVTSNNTKLSTEKSSVSWISGNYMALSRFPAGDYRLTENASPDGYSTAKTITFSIDSKINISNFISGTKRIGGIKCFQ